MNILITNFGKESVALIQWAHEQKLADIQVISVDTGWGALSWEALRRQGEQWLKKLEKPYHHLSAPKTMQELVIDRKEFPSKKFQWCAGFLKGLAINEYLDNVDIETEATILLAKRKQSSRANRWLHEHEESEHYQGRTIWYPLLDFSDSQRDGLLSRTGLKVLGYRSDECAPCIHSSLNDMARFSASDIKRLKTLEGIVDKPMFPIQQTDEARCIEHMDMGCGSVWGCGE